MKKTILLLFTLITTLGFSQDSKVEVPTIAVKVALGELVIINDVTLEFLEVLEDSRCPKDVTCVWAGQAKVLVQVTEAGKSSQQVELLFGGNKDNLLFASEEFNLKGISLSPYPTSETVGKLEYALLVSEVKKQD